MVNWWRLLFAMLVSLIISVLLIALVRPAAIGFIAGLIVAAWVVRVNSPSDGALVCSVAAIPAGIYYGFQAVPGYANPTGLPELLLLAAGPLLGAIAFAALGSLLGAFLGLMVSMAQKGRFPFF